MHVVVRADGGPDIGYGHLVRTSALAAEFQARGHEVTYATVTPQHVRTTCPSSVGVVEVRSRSDPDALVGQLRDVDVVIVDSYATDTAYQRRLRAETPLVLVSDRPRHPVCADVVVNGNLYAADLTYEVVGREPTWCLGPAYVLLRRSIRTLADEVRVQPERASNAVVTFGGSDVGGLTDIAVKAFDGYPVEVTAVLGPGVTDDSDARATAARVDAEVTVVQDPSNFAELLHTADFAVTACGSTVYELLALGTPMICTPVVDNQRPIADALSERGLADVVARDSFQADIGAAIATHVRNGRLRRERARRGQALIDARGAERVCEQTLSVIRDNR